MIKVLFVLTNINGEHTEAYHFGLASILSSTRKAGYSCKLVIVKHKDEYSKILDAVHEFQPRVVGFTAVSSQFYFVKELCTLIKKQSPGTINVCGGVHTTINPECVAENPDLDGIFRGECEVSFVDFLERIDKNKNYREVSNYAYIKDDQVVINKMRPLLYDLDSLPFPDREIYPSEEQLEQGGFATFFFSRGCPYCCTYCSNHAIARQYGLEKSVPRYRSPDSCIREIEECLKKIPSIDSLFIMDDIFGIDKQWRNEFCDLYAKRIKIRFIILLRINLVDEKFLKILKRAGCYNIMYGVESGNEYIRNTVMKRNMSNKKIIDVFDMTHQFGIRTNALNMMGMPGETEEMLWDTINLNRRIKPTTSGCSIFYPYKGTILGDYCFSENLVDIDMYNDFSNERRGSVLKFPKEWKKKLVNYNHNWEKFVYGFNLKRALQKEIQKTIIWKPLLRMKRKASNLMLQFKG